MKHQSIFNLFTAYLIIATLQNIHSQEHYDFKGLVIVQDTVMLPYQLNFSVNKGVISGYSMTDAAGEHETKNSISGLYDEKSDYFSFQENDIEYTKSVISENDFCRINFKGVLKLASKRTRIKGAFVGLYQDGSKCIDGTLNLMKTERILKKVEKITKRISRSVFVDSLTKSKITTEKLLGENEINSLKEGESTSVFWESDKLVMEINDIGVEDDDRISIYVNGVKVLNNFSVKKINSVVEVDISKKIKNEIIIKAENQGTIGINSVRVRLVDLKKQIDLNTKLNTNQETRILIHRR
jgi:hypothetical protein